jgi:pSer/pThr/pTyr-binding forkhead associated (FHA) protein/LysM repeat protein
MADGEPVARILRVIPPEGEARTVRLEGAELQVGSAIESTLVLGGHGVSARHCRIELRGDQVFVVDRGSRNGTFVNSRRIVEPTELKEGDRIGVGAYTLELAAPKVLAGRKQAADKLRVEEVKLNRGDEERRTAERERMLRYAREWQAKGRPRRLLLHASDLAAASAWPAAERSADPTLAALIEATTRAQRLKLGLGLGLGGAVLAAGAIYWVAAGTRTRDVPPPPVERVAEVAVPKDSPGEPALDVTQAAKMVEHEVRPGETYEDIARYYGVSLAMLQKFNTISLGDPAVPGTKLKMMSTKPPRPPMQEELYVVSPGDDWRSIAGYYKIGLDDLRRQNPKYGDQLRGDEELRFMVESEPFAAKTPNPDDLPIFIVPEGASSEGSVTGGALRNAVQLLPSPLVSIRCSMNSFATDYTVKALLGAVAEFRRQGYTGELMVGDLSLRDGGKYKLHKSHQSGRDADIWLLVKRKAYTKGCKNCSTDSCRPEPEDVDWAAQWRFIKALDTGGLVQEIFLSHHLQELLYNAGKAQGAKPEELARMIQWPRRPGTPALVMHSDGHVHHTHVRFKCDPTDTACSNQK